MISWTWYIAEEKPGSPGNRDWVTGDKFFIQNITPFIAGEKLLKNAWASRKRRYFWPSVNFQIKFLSGDVSFRGRKKSARAADSRKCRSGFRSHESEARAFGNIGFLVSQWFATFHIGINRSIVCIRNRAARVICKGTTWTRFQCRAVLTRYRLFISRGLLLVDPSPSATLAFFSHKKRVHGDKCISRLKYFIECICFRVFCDKIAKNGKIFEIETDSRN